MNSPSPVPAKDSKEATEKPKTKPNEKATYTHKMPDIDFEELREISQVYNAIFRDYKISSYHFMFGFNMVEVEDYYSKIVNLKINDTLTLPVYFESNAAPLVKDEEFLSILKKFINYHLDHEIDITAPVIMYAEKTNVLLS